MGWGLSFTREEAALNGNNLANAFNCSSEIEKCLRKVEALDLVRWLHQENLTICDHCSLRPETAFFFETRPNIDAFSSSQPVLPYPPQEMLDFQLFNQVVGQSITELLHPFGQVPVLIGGTSGEAATFMKYCFILTI